MEARVVDPVSEEDVKVAKRPQVWSHFRDPKMPYRERPPPIGVPTRRRRSEPNAGAAGAAAVTAMFALDAIASPRDHRRSLGSTSTNATLAPGLASLRESFEKRKEKGTADDGAASGSASGSGDVDPGAPSNTAHAESVRLTMGPKGEYDGIGWYLVAARQGAIVRAAVALESAVVLELSHNQHVLVAEMATADTIDTPTKQQVSRVRIKKPIDGWISLKVVARTSTAEERGLLENEKYEKYPELSVTPRSVTPRRTWNDWMTEVNDDMTATSSKRDVGVGDDASDASEGGGEVDVPSDPWPRRSATKMMIAEEDCLFVQSQIDASLIDAGLLTKRSLAHSKSDDRYLKSDGHTEDVSSQPSGQGLLQATIKGLTTAAKHIPVYLDNNEKTRLEMMVHSVSPELATPPPAYHKRNFFHDGHAESPSQRGISKSEPFLTPKSTARVSAWAAGGEVPTPTARKTDDRVLAKQLHQVCHYYWAILLDINHILTTVCPVLRALFTARSPCDSCHAWWRCSYNTKPTKAV